MSSSVPQELINIKIDWKSQLSPSGEESTRVHFPHLFLLDYSLSCVDRFTFTR